MKKSPKTNRKVSTAKDSGMHLRLYVAGQTPKSLAALTNLKRICADHMEGKYQLEVIDLVKNPQLAHGDQIIAIPTLVRNLPVPIRKIIGDLSNADHVLIGLDLRPGDQKTAKSTPRNNGHMGAKT